MKDNLLILIKEKQTIAYLEKHIQNFPRTEKMLRDNIKQELYTLLKNTYRANIINNIDKFVLKQEILVNIKMIDFYLTEAFYKKLISEKMYKKLGEYFLEIFILVRAWIKSEEKK